MAIAEAGAPRRRSSLLPKRKYERRPRIVANRRARAALSREARWKRRGRSIWPKLLALLAAIGLAAGAWMLWRPAPVPEAAPLAYPALVAEANALFPEALSDHTRATVGRLADGRAVAAGMTLLVPAHTLDSPGASVDALTRLSAPFVGRERTISAPEMGGRVGRLAGIAVPDGVERCYSFDIGAARTVARGEGRTVRVRPLEIDFGAGC